MKSILKKLLLIPALLMAGLLHPAHAQQAVICDNTTSAPCSPTTNPGDGTQGDPAWEAFGKVNANFDLLPSELFASAALSILHGGTGQTTAAGAINSLLPSQTGFNGDCLGTNGTVASWIVCGSSSGINSLGLTVPSFLSVTPATLTANGTFAVTYSGTPLPVANGGSGTASPGLVAGSNVTVTGSWPNQTINSSGGTGLIAGTTTSTALIAAYPPSSNAGASALTSDMGVMRCDGVRWNVVGTPPVPPGALVLGYNHPVFVAFPVVADIGSGNTPGQYRIYSGYLGLNTSEPPVNSTTFTTDTNGQLQLHYTGVTNGSGVFTIVPFYTAPLAQDYGQLGLATGARGWYMEMAFHESSNNTDIWDTLFSNPQEHNPTDLYDQPGSPYPTNYFVYNELDVTESGHGTDYSGAYQGNYIQWAGPSTSGAVTVPISSATATATTISLTTPWTGDSSSSVHPFHIKFGSGETRDAPLVNGSTGPFTLSSALSSNETTATLNGNASLSNNNITNSTSVDYTVEHIIGASYDPIGQLYTVWKDGVEFGQVSTSNLGNSNAYRDALHQLMIVATQSHGAHFVHWMDVRYIALWAP